MRRRFATITVSLAAVVIVLLMEVATRGNGDRLARRGGSHSKRGHHDQDTARCPSKTANLDAARPPVYGRTP
jgi:hypothetical protein